MLTKEQKSFIVRDANERGGLFDPPYVFESAKLVGVNQDFLFIVIKVVSTGALFGHSKRGAEGWADDPTLFEEIVDHVLVGAQRNIGPPP